MKITTYKANETNNFSVMGFDKDKAIALINKYENWLISNNINEINIRIEGMKTARIFFKKENSNELIIANYSEKQKNLNIKKVVYNNDYTTTKTKIN